MSDPIERPLTFIRDTAADFAQSKADRVYLEQFRKSKKALLMAQAQRDGVKTAAAQEVYAYAHDEYLQVLDGLRVAVEREELLSLRIKAAQLQIDLHRTREASRRAEMNSYGM